MVVRATVEVNRSGVGVAANPDPRLDLAELVATSQMANRLRGHHMVCEVGPE
jgi:hypothetical protein